MLAVVTNYYNPNHDNIKRINFDLFLKGMTGLPVYVVEAAFGDDQFELVASNTVFQVRCRDLLWQQYTLVNLVIKKLPPEYTKAVWVDADILFDDSNWYKQMDLLLDKFKLVQSYRSVDLLARGNSSGSVKESVAYIALKNAKKPTASVLSSNLDLSSKYHSGLSWGVQREVIERFRIYDYWVTGSCDTALVIAAWGDWKNDFLQSRLNERMRQHYLEWAKPFHEYIDGSIGCLDAHIRHLYHGQRNYRKRWQCLKEFDPYTDIQLNSGGVLEWTTDKPEMHTCCRNMCLDYEVDFCPFL